MGMKQWELLALTVWDYPCVAFRYRAAQQPILVDFVVQGRQGTRSPARIMYHYCNKYLMSHERLVECCELLQLYNVVTG